MVDFHRDGITKAAEEAARQGDRDIAEAMMELRGHPDFFKNGDGIVERSKPLPASTFEQRVSFTSKKEAEALLEPLCDKLLDGMPTADEMRTGHQADVEKNCQWKLKTVREQRLFKEVMNYLTDGDPVARNLEYLRPGAYKRGHALPDAIRKRFSMGGNNATYGKSAEELIERNIMKPEDRQRLNDEERSELEKLRAEMAQVQANRTRMAKARRNRKLVEKKETVMASGE